MTLRILNSYGLALSVFILALVFRPVDFWSPEKVESRIAQNDRLSGRTILGLIDHHLNGFAELRSISTERLDFIDKNGTRKSIYKEGEALVVENGLLRSKTRFEVNLKKLQFTYTADGAILLTLSTQGITKDSGHSGYEYHTEARKIIIDAEGDLFLAGK